MIKTKLLDYYKLVLSKVSFEPKLFFKEYKKATKALGANEIGDLDIWLKESGLNAAHLVRHQAQRKVMSVKMIGPACR